LVAGTIIIISERFCKLFSAFGSQAKLGVAEPKSGSKKSDHLAVFRGENMRLANVTFTQKPGSVNYNFIVHNYNCLVI
tara:strand:- start:65 stop:298 length:234 start_codon:yes stop_codon:yes gene_type:complete